MTSWEGKRPVTIVSACMTANGRPAFGINEVVVTHEEAENGIHLYLAEAELLEAGFEEPFVHFDDFERPAFLLPAIEQYLGLAPVLTESIPVVRSEES